MCKYNFEDHSKNYEAMTNFIAIKRAENDKNGATQWLCRCKHCKVEIFKTSILIKKCPDARCKKCMLSKKSKDWTGFKKGLMMVQRSSGGKWECICSKCKTLTVRDARSFKMVKFEKCLCKSAKGVSKDFEWFRHRGMHHSARQRKYPCTICATWSFDQKGNEQRQTDMGPRPIGFSTDRIDDRLRHYSKDNCKYSCQAEQVENKESNIFLKHTKTGNVRCSTWWAKELGINRNTFIRQFKAGKHTNLKLSNYSEFFKYKIDNPIDDYEIVIAVDCRNTPVYLTTRLLIGARERCKWVSMYKGIPFHPPWDDDINLMLQYLGFAPKGMSVDRIDSRLGYIPGNVRYADRITQAANQQTNVFYKNATTGEILCQTHWARKMGFNNGVTLKYQIAAGKHPNLIKVEYGDYVDYTKRRHVNDPLPFPEV